MEQLIERLIQQQKKCIKLSKTQNRLIAKMLALLEPSDKEQLKKNIIDNADLKEIFKVADTKFFRLKKLFKTYALDNKDYYLAGEILETLRLNQRHEPDDNTDHQNKTTTKDK